MRSVGGPAYPQQCVGQPRSRAPAAARRGRDALPARHALGRLHTWSRPHVTESIAASPVSTTHGAAGKALTDARELTGHIRGWRRGFLPSASDRDDGHVNMYISRFAATRGGLGVPQQCGQYAHPQRERGRINIFRYFGYLCVVNISTYCQHLGVSTRTFNIIINNNISVRRSFNIFTDP